MPKSVTDQINEALSAVLTPSGIEQWWGTPVPMWLGMTPRDMVDQGDTAMVLDHALAYGARENEAFT